MKARQHEELGKEFLARGLPMAASAEFHRWLILVEPTGDPHLILPPYLALCNVSQSLLDFARALVWLEGARPYLSNVRAAPKHALKFCLAEATCLARLGQIESAIAGMHAALPQLSNPADQLPLGQYHLVMGQLLILRQDWAGAALSASRALDSFSESAQPQLLAAAHLQSGTAHLHQGSITTAHEDLGKAFRLADRPAPVYIQMGRLALAEGKQQEAFWLGTQALDLLLGEMAALDKSEIAQVSELLGDLFATSGQRRLALKYLNRAAAYFAQLGQSGPWERLRQEIDRAMRMPERMTQFPMRNQLWRLDFLSALLELADEVEAIDPHLRGHSERVTNLAVAFGRHLGLGIEDLRLLRYAGYLHDVGLIVVDAEILNKPDQLTPAERLRLHLHPEMSQKMAATHGLDARGQVAIRHHHERWDGTGYPDGLTGKQIPMLARVLALAEIYDALTTERIHRKAHTHGEALDLIKAMSGRELDPEMVHCFLEMHLR